jgi:hypothetical protein
MSFSRNCDSMRRPACRNPSGLRRSATRGMSQCDAEDVTVRRGVCRSATRRVSQRDTEGVAVRHGGCRSATQRVSQCDTVGVAVRHGRCRSATRERRKGPGIAYHCDEDDHAARHNSFRTRQIRRARRHAPPHTHLNRFTAKTNDSAAHAARMTSPETCSRSVAPSL